MKNFVSHPLKCAVGLLLVAASIVVGPSKAIAQNAEKPAVVFSVASIEHLMGNLGYLTRAAGMPEYGAIVPFVVAPYIEGLDATQPAGGYVTFTPQPTAVIFAPVADFETVTKNIEEMVGELQDVGGGVKKLKLQREIFFKEQNGWMFATDRQANLNDLPADPKAMLEGMYEKYDIAIRANVPSVPAELREMLLSEITEGFDRTVEKEADEDKRRSQREVGSRVIGRIGRFASEADQLTVGWGTNSDDRITFIDFSATALPNTNLAKEIDSAVSLKSEFTGFLVPDAAATIHFVAPVLKQDVEQILVMLDKARDTALGEIDKDDDLPNDEARAMAKDIVGSLMDVLKETVKAGRLNGGAALLLEPQNINFVAGGFVADGKSVEKDLKRLVKLAQASKENSGVEVKFDAGSHGGVALHTVVVPVPSREEEARKILGDKMVTVIGTGAKSVYLAFGDDSMELLKQVIDNSADSGEKNSPMSLSVALSPILSFAASIDDDPVVAGLAENLKNSRGKDRIVIKSNAIPQGIAYRVELGQDVLQLIGAAAKMKAAEDREPF